MNTNTAYAGSAAVTGQPGTRQLRRSGDDKMLAGVAAYIAAWRLIAADGQDHPAAGARAAGRPDRIRQIPQTS
jgi:hypothetical protein